MNDGHPQSALREWRAHMAHPVTLIAVLAIAAVLGVAGPFGTDDRLALLQRLVYWLAIVALTYGIGSICDALVTWRMARLRFWLNVTITALVTGVCANLVVIGVNLITFGWLPGTAELPTFLATTFGIAAIVTTALALVKQQAPEATASPPPAPPQRIAQWPSSSAPSAAHSPQAAERCAPRAH